MTGALVIAATVTVAQPLEIKGNVPGCIVKDQNAVITANVVGDPQAVRVYFHSNAGREFYYVVGSKVPEGWVVKLPKPAVPPTEKIFVYIEAISNAKQPSRTADATIFVLDSCTEKAAFVPPGAISVVGTTVVPVGFLGTGVTTAVAAAAAGGGILGMSTATAVLVGVGVVGAGVGIVAIANSDDESPK